MNMRFFFYMISALFIILTAGCSKDSSDSDQPDQWVTRCFTILDSRTGSPVVNADLYIAYDFSIAAVDGYYGTSDMNGLICEEIRSDARPNYFRVTKENYQMICNSMSEFPPKIIYMDYQGYLKFVIKNEEPFTEQDRIDLSYTNLYCNGNDNISLSGSNIDTTLIRACRPLNAWINVVSTGVNPFTDQIQVNAISRDTTVVNIIY